MKCKNILGTSVLAAILVGTPFYSGCKNNTRIEQKILQPPYNASELSFAQFKAQMSEKFPCVRNYSDSEWEILYTSYSTPNENPETAVLNDSYVKKYAPQFPWIDNKSTVKNLKVGDKNFLSRIAILEGIPIN